VIALEAEKIYCPIGTHRLLSKDVRFHDLGLLIVDEEGARPQDVSGCLAASA
jgi:transcription-repair coupling factor (superfamily II helicase)